MHKADVNAKTLKEILIGYGYLAPAVLEEIETNNSKVAEPILKVIKDVKK